MTSLDIGRLAAYHRRDLAAEMRICREADTVEYPAMGERRLIHRVIGMRCALGLAIERWGKRVQGNGAVRAGTSEQGV